MKQNRPRMNRLAIQSLPLAGALLLSACSSWQINDQAGSPAEPVSLIRTQHVEPARSDDQGADADEIRRTGKTLLEEQGSGLFVNEQARQATELPGREMVNVSFESAPIADVLKVLMGDLLEVPYTLEASVDGNITLVSTSPIPRAAVLELLESALEVQGIGMLKDGSGVYRVGRIENLRREVPVAGLGAAGGAGYSIRIVPLKHLSVTEAKNLLEPLGMAGSILRVDTLRNILMLGAAGPQMQNALRTLRMLDVDVLAGMSIGVYEVVNLDAATLVERLNVVLATPEMEQLASSARMTALEEINSVMVVAPSSSKLRTIRDWLTRLDAIGLDDEQAGTQLFVYSVQNGEAAQIAALLGQIFGDGSTSTPPRTAGQVAPGLAQSELTSASGESSGASAVSSFGRATGRPAGGATTSVTASGTRIVADEVNNSLLVMASAKEWRTIRSALDKLDKAPAQVLVEVSIWEVTLTDELSYGVDWFFNTNTGIDGVVGGGLLSMQNSGAVSRSVPGFSYVFTGSDWRAVINTLATKSNVKSLSSPSILVLDNREASIQVGAQQPFSSSQTVNTGNSDLLTQNVELKDTGVMLKIKPRVNSGGLVVMDIQQEVTDVGELDQATGQRSFLKRNVESSVAIQSGDTIILGGLIQDAATDSSGGVPILSDIPVLGALFGTKNNNTRRTELLVTISPRAVNQYRDFDRIGEEFSHKMKGLTESFRSEFSQNN